MRQQTVRKAQQTLQQIRIHRKTSRQQMIVITIDTENQAFADSEQIEVARILHVLADRFDKHGLPSDDHTVRLMDINGNFVGRASNISADD